MIITNTRKNIKIIGYEESTFTIEWLEATTLNSYGRFKVDVIEPNDFLAMEGKEEFQYAVAFSKDLELRKKVCDLIENTQLDCFSVFHTGSMVSPGAYLGLGVCVMPLATVCTKSSIGNFSFLSPYTLIGHFSSIGRESILRPGAKIAGRTTVGDRLVMGMNSSILEGLTVANDVTVAAFSGLTKNVDAPGYYVGTPARRFGGKTEDKL